MFSRLSWRQREVNFAKEEDMKLELAEGKKESPEVASTTLVRGLQSTQGSSFFEDRF